MNFFARQDAARRQSKRLVVLFVMAVFAIVAAVDLVLLLAAGKDAGVGTMVFGAVCTLAIIGGASMFRSASLSRGGAAVAHELGATPVPESTTDFQLRRLRNVVEEIAIASGVPVPQIFVLEEEAGINAFAAGYSPSDAAITVTRGALTRLNRDELQGVIAHEFSHILNGDMRLNIRLIGLLFGIMVLALIGRKILGWGRGRSSRDSGGIYAVAFAVMVIGYVGLFFGRLIKAGVSRQREYLADASAVQFTRQTRGIAGALKKVAGLAEGSRLVSDEAEEVAHMLFGDGVGYSSLMATHPPLLDRIKALEPNFRAERLDELAADWEVRPPVGLAEDEALGLTGRDGPLPGANAEVQLSAPAVIAQVGAPQSDDYHRAAAVADAIPAVLQEAARDHGEVVPLMFGLLLSAPGPVRDHQQFELSSRSDERTARQAQDYADRLADLHPLLRLPLAALAFPLLRRRPRPELHQFMDTVYALVHADGKVSLFEYCLGRLLQVQVTESLDPSRAWVPGRRRLADTTEAVLSLFAVVARAGHDDAASAQRAFIAGVAKTFPRLNAVYRPPVDLLAALDNAWPVLDAVEPMGKELLIEGLVAAISSDGRVSVAEAELLRVVCASLHCPLPPMLEAMTSPAV